MDTILKRVNGMLYQVEGATAFGFPVPPISGLSIAGGFTVRAAGSRRQLT